MGPKMSDYIRKKPAKSRSGEATSGVRPQFDRRSSRGTRSLDSLEMKLFEIWLNGHHQSQNLHQQQQQASNNKVPVKLQVAVVRNFIIFTSAAPAVDRLHFQPAESLRVVSRFDPVVHRAVHFVSQSAAGARPRTSAARSPAWATTRASRSPCAPDSPAPPRLAGWFSCCGSRTATGTMWWTRPRARPPSPGAKGRRGDATICKALSTLMMTTRQALGW
ncbi:uncharacterized protein LOC132198108 isoform X2 [Neocloeon triangulifer]|uniref:uncharacterized protein LOC132198108 isoform X2 n=1 Tax=Neocloeon triangulifer TaxID=2078957 RepID=UPI00286F77FD|nr:uncharacterized protein LOC132198108 isoform X2 [Neocloeon triangulifer]